MNRGDPELARAIQAGSNEAFEELMQRYRRLVYRIAYGFTGDAEEALDVCQETFLKVHERLGSWRGEGDLKNWIARIASNEASNRKRSALRHPMSELSDAAIGPGQPRQHEAVIRREDEDALHRSLSVLGPRPRLAVILRYFEGMPNREIAAVLDCSEETARNLLFRSLRKLRAVLAESKGAMS